jgi:hypothetical protein
MNKNNFGHFIMVSLNYFFNIDPTFCKHALVAAMLLPVICRFFISAIATYFYDGLLIVKEDSVEINTLVSSLKDKWQSGEVYSVMQHSARMLRDNISQKNIWRLK